MKKFMNSSSYAFPHEVLNSSQNIHSAALSLQRVSEILKACCSNVIKSPKFLLVTLGR